MSMPKSSKMLQFINWRIRVTIQDGRVIVGRFLAFDKHMNVVICDAEEFRRIKQKGKEDREEKRTLGMVLIRGETVVSLSAESPPPEEVKAKAAPQVPGGPGIGRAVGRGMMPSAPPGANNPVGLTGPVRGVGAAAPGSMMPVGRGFPPGMMPPPPPGGPMGRGFPPGMMPPPPPGGPMGRGFPPGMMPPGGVFPPGMMPPGAMGRGFPPGVPPPGIIPPGMGRGFPPGVPPPFSHQQQE